jgi:pyruvate ferredoxin oxidoreductase alpha subunit
MSLRDSGWIQLYVESNQEAVDVHIQAFKLAEETSLPVMVCMDGFVLTHAVEQVDIPEQEQVDAYLPAFVPRQVLDPVEPMTIGAMVGPEAFTEVRYIAHAKQIQALDRIPELAGEFTQTFGRTAGGLLRRYRTEGADTIVVALGSVLGTIEDVVDELREEGMRIGAVGVKCFRPFPVDELRDALKGPSRVIVVERAFSVGLGGIVGQDVRLALSGTSTSVYDVVAGLGGRAVTRRSLRRLFMDVLEDRLEPDRLVFLDLDWRLVERELARLSEGGRSGPHAENILRDLGIVAARSH